MYELCIAGFEFQIHCLPHLTLKEEDSSYSGFWQPEAEIPVVESIPVEFWYGDALPFDVKKTRPVSESWRYYADRNARFALFVGGKSGQRCRLVRLSRRGDSVTVTEIGDPADDRSDRLVVNPLHFPIDMVVMSMLLASRRGLVLHAAGWVLGDKALVLAAAGGGGKSTLAGLLHRRGRGLLLSDDRVVLRLGDNGVTAWGTPWAGSAGYAANVGAQATEILFLSKGRSNRILEMDSGEAMDCILQVSTVPWYDAELTSMVLDTVEAVLRTVPLRRLEFVPQDSAAEFLASYLASL